MKTPNLFHFFFKINYEYPKYTYNTLAIALVKVGTCSFTWSWFTHTSEIENLGWRKVAIQFKICERIISCICVVSNAFYDELQAFWIENKETLITFLLTSLFRFSFYNVLYNLVSLRILFVWTSWEFWFLSPRFSLRVCGYS